MGSEFSATSSQLQKHPSSPVSYRQQSLEPQELHPGITHLSAPDSTGMADAPLPWEFSVPESGMVITGVTKWDIPQSSMLLKAESQGRATPSSKSQTFLQAFTWHLRFDLMEKQGK